MRRVTLEARGYRCERCKGPGKLEVHHIIPLEYGGDETPDNLEVLCRDCHIDEHAGPLTRARVQLRKLARSLVSR